MGTLLAIYGISLIASGIFPPDPADGFPPGQATVDGSLSGILHLAFGAIGFLALGSAALTFARWTRARDSRTTAALCAVSGAVVILGFGGGATLATSSAGVLLLWVDVVTGFAWLLISSLYAYRTVPHPDAHRR